MLRTGNSEFWFGIQTQIVCTCFNTFINIERSELAAVECQGLEKLTRVSGFHYGHSVISTFQRNVWGVPGRLLGGCLWHGVWCAGCLLQRVLGTNAKEGQGGRRQATVQAKGWEQICPNPWDVLWLEWPSDCLARVEIARSYIPISISYGNKLP